MAQTDLKKKTGAESQISTWGPTDLIKKLTDLKKKTGASWGLQKQPGSPVFISGRLGLAAPEGRVRGHFLTFLNILVVKRDQNSVKIKKIQHFGQSASEASVGHG